MKKVVVFFAMLCACTTISAQTNWKSRYDKVDDFYEDLAIVRSNCKYGFVDRVGRSIIPLKYDFAFPFNDGIACVVLNGKYGFIDKIGREIVPIKQHDNLLLNERFAKLDAGGYAFPNTKATAIAATPTTTTSTAATTQSQFPNFLEEEFVTVNYDNGTYNGLMIFGIKTKYGVYKWNNGDRYVGQWKDNCPNGLGIYLWKRGNKYVGDWDNGHRQGDGAEYDATGKLIYYGRYENGKYLDPFPSVGYSPYKFENISYTTGDRYEGETKNRNRDGFGIYYWKDGSFWFGRWENNIRNGHGVFYPKNGAVITGKWLGDDKIE